MHLNPYINFPDITHFTPSRLEEVCIALGGDSATLSYAYDDLRENELSHATFLVGLKQSQYEGISGDCSKYLHPIIATRRPLYERDVLFPFNCIVTLATRSHMLYIEDTAQGQKKQELIVSVVQELEIGKLHFSFFEERPGYQLKYHLLTSHTKPWYQATVFKFVVIPRNDVIMPDDIFSKS